MIGAHIPSICSITQKTRPYVLIFRGKSIFENIRELGIKLGALFLNSIQKLNPRFNVYSFNVEEGNSSLYLNKVASP